MNKLLILAVAALLSPVAAFADITIDSGFPTPQGGSVVVGQNITFTVRADTDGSGNDNDWKSTEWDVITDGVPAECVNTPQITQSTNNATASWQYTAVQAGSKTVQVRVFNSPNCQGSARDTETTGLTVTNIVVVPIDVCPNVDGTQLVGPCADILCVSPDTWSQTNQQCESPVVVVPPAGPSTPAPTHSSISGGGGYTFCDLDTQPTANLRDIAMCVDRSTGKIVQSLAWRGAGGHALLYTNPNNEQIKVLLNQVVALLLQQIQYLKTH